MNDMLTIAPGDTSLDGHLAKPLELAKNNSLEAQRLALDCTQLLSRAADRVAEVSGQGFFKRVWGRLNGAAVAAERASKQDMLHLQRASFRYLEMLGQQNLLTLDAVATVRNQLSYVLTDARDTKEQLRHLAEQTRETILALVDTLEARFDSLERRIERIETTSAIHGWLLTIDDFEYDRYPEAIRLLKIVADYRTMKDANWTMDDFRCLKTALRRTGIDPLSHIRVEEFIRRIAVDNYPNKYTKDINGLLDMEAVDSIRVTDEISLPLLSCLYGFAAKYQEHVVAVNDLVQSSHVSTHPTQAVSDLMISRAKHAGIDTNAEVEYRHLALELLTGVSMAKEFAPKGGFVCRNMECLNHKRMAVFFSVGFCDQCGRKLDKLERH